MVFANPGLKVSLPTVDPRSFAVLLRFMYTGTVGRGASARVPGRKGGTINVPVDGEGRFLPGQRTGGALRYPLTLAGTMSLLALAFDLEVLPLRDYCHDLLMRDNPFPSEVAGGASTSTFRLHDCGFILRFAERHAIPKLARRCVRFIAANIVEMVSCPQRATGGGMVGSIGGHESRARAPICDLEGDHLNLVVEELAARFASTTFGSKMTLTAILAWLEWRFHQPLHSHPVLQEADCAQSTDLINRVDWSCISEMDARIILSKFATLRSSKMIAHQIFANYDNNGEAHTGAGSSSQSLDPAAHTKRAKLEGTPSCPPGQKHVVRSGQIGDGGGITGHQDSNNATAVENDGKKVLTVLPLL